MFRIIKLGTVEKLILAITTSRFSSGVKYTASSITATFFKVNAGGTAIEIDTAIGTNGVVTLSADTGSITGFHTALLDISGLTEKIYCVVYQATVDNVTAIAPPEYLDIDAERKKIADYVDASIAAIPQTLLIYPLEVIGLQDGYGDIRDPIKFIKGESKIKWYQLKSETTGEILDITNYTFKLAVKSNYRDVVYLIDPFIAEKDIPNKKFGFVFNAAKTANVAKGVFEIAMYDNSNPSQKTVLTPAGGVQFGIYEDIIDT